MAKGKRWSGKEETKLRALVNKGLTSEAISKEMPERSLSAIRNHRKHVSTPRTAKRWSKEEDTQLKDLVLAKKTSDQIARSLGRTYAAILARKSQLGIEERIVNKRYAKVARKANNTVEAKVPRIQNVLTQLSDAIHSVSTLGLKITVTIAKD